VERRSSLTRGGGRGDDGARSSPRRIATRRDAAGRGRLDGSLQLFASDIDDRGGGGDAIKSERASEHETLRETEKKFASKFRRCVAEGAKQQREVRGVVAWRVVALSALPPLELRVCRSAAPPLPPPPPGPE